MAPRILAVFALIAVPAAAQPAAPLELAYAGYTSGLNVLDVQASVAMSPQTYRVKVSYHLTGFVSVLFSAESTTTVDGQFRGDVAEPRELFSAGRMRGQQRVTQIDWQNGNPVISQLVPPAETEREPVPPEQQAHTIDSLSAMALLLHDVAKTGRCEGAMTTFDGRRLSSLEAHTAGEEVLPPSDRSSFQGNALRCDFEGRQLAGFVRDADVNDLRRPQRGSAWFASIAPGEPPVPVRIVFHARLLGDMTMYLTARH